MKKLIIIMLALSLSPALYQTGAAGGQSQALKTRYAEAMARAQAKEFERAYDMAFKIIREDEFYYEAQILRIALATILKKTGREDPKNLLRVVKDYAPLGSNPERDAQNMINQLSGTPTLDPKETGSAKEIAVSPYVRKKVALVVGVGSFIDKRINPLTYPAIDARAFADTLTKECKFNEVKVLVDAEATRHNILTEINNIAKTAQPDDLVVIYIAGHGSPEDLDSAGVNYIVTHDSVVDNLYPTSYKMKDLLDDIQTRIRAQRIVAFIDTCFSGATFKQMPIGWASSSRGLKIESSGLQIDKIGAQLRGTTRGIKITHSSAAEGRRQQDIGRVIIASSRQNEKSWESDSIKHGYFTYYLIEAIKNQGAVSIQSLYEYLSAEVSKAVQRDRNASQNPTMVSSINGPVKFYLKD
jgi:caspase domain-containing protein